MTDKFSKRESELVRSDNWGDNIWGISTDARYSTVAGVSRVSSTVCFLDEVAEDELVDVPDYILSDTLDKDLNVVIQVCALILTNTKYFPSDTKIGGQFGSLPAGEREGAVVGDWRDFSIENCEGQPLYTEADLQKATAENKPELGAALWFIVKDICDSGGFLSEDWYRARILLEYFSDYPVSADSAYLIGELHKELTIKLGFEGDLASYYTALAASEEARLRGGKSTKEKAEQLREKCVRLFAELYAEKGPRLLIAPDETKAEELMRAALSKWPDEYQRGGRPYRKEWFLRHVIEDRRLEIARALEAVEAQKG